MTWPMRSSKRCTASLSSLHKTRQQLMRASLRPVLRIRVAPLLQPLLLLVSEVLEVLEVPEHAVRSQSLREQARRRALGLPPEAAATLPPVTVHSTYQAALPLHHLATEVVAAALHGRHLVLRLQRSMQRFHGSKTQHPRLASCHRLARGMRVPCSQMECTSTAAAATRRLRWPTCGALSWRTDCSVGLA